MRRSFSLLIAILAPFLLAGAARAFCGFYVSGADASLYNSATMVVMMREGSRTVLSMQNNYQGPPQDFAMVVPVPVVLQEENVRTLPREIFDRVDQLAAPRLVEYWETDPCNPRPIAVPRSTVRRRSGRAGGGSEEAAGFGVTVEAEFSVAEYDIVILSATDSSGLDAWLRHERYNIPEGAEPVLRPYVAAGTKFFVAKVDIERVTFVDGKAVLSPLRFHYDSPDFSLPVRLGLLNSSGQQDLIVHILARAQRYEVANYPNATIPTNIEVTDAVRHSYGQFYDLVFRRTVASNPGSVITEYSWDAGSCDPCPVPGLTPSELMTLGADVVDAAAGVTGRPGPGRGGFFPSGFVLTRLHYRYGQEGLNEDLVFRAAPPIVGGRGMPDASGALGERDAAPSGVNNFQGRYVILHRWEGPVACESPVRGQWGGPPGRPTPPVFGARNAAMDPTTLGRSADAPADVTPVASLGLAVAVDVPRLRVTAGTAEQALAGDPGPPGGAPPVVVAPPTTTPPVTVPGATALQEPTSSIPGAAADGGGCGSCAAATPRAGAGPLGATLVVGVLLLRRRRRLRA